MFCYAISITASTAAQTDTVARRDYYCLEQQIRKSVF